MRGTLQQHAKRYAYIIWVLLSQQDLQHNTHLRAVHRGARHLSMSIRLGDPLKLETALKLAEPLALSCGADAVLAQRLGGVVSYQIELPRNHWEFYTRADLADPGAIGLGEQRRPVLFSFDPAPHSLIAGTTGSGKSETVKSILVALTQLYTPDEIEIVLVDPDQELTDFENTDYLARFDYGSIATRSSEIAAALQWVYGQLQHRRQNNLKNEKIIILAIDETSQRSVLGSKEGGLNKENVAVVRDLAEHARKYRIFLLLGSQKPSYADLPGIFDKLNNRFVGYVADASLSARLTGQPGLQAHRLSKQGDFLHVAGSEVIRFQVAQATRADFDRLPRGNKSTISGTELVKAPPVPLEMPDPGGRPAVELNAKLLAAYFYHGPQRITYALAEELFNLKRTGHILHRDFCVEFAREYMRLRRAGIQALT